MVDALLLFAFGVVWLWLFICVADCFVGVRVRVVIWLVVTGVCCRFPVCFCIVGTWWLVLVGIMVVVCFHWFERCWGWLMCGFACVGLIGGCGAFDGFRCLLVG